MVCWQHNQKWKNEWSGNNQILHPIPFDLLTTPNHASHLVHCFTSLYLLTK